LGAGVIPQPESNISVAMDNKIGRGQASSAERKWSITLPDEHCAALLAEMCMVCLSYSATDSTLPA